MSKDNVVHFPGVSRAIVERISKAKSESELEKLLGEDVRSHEKRVDNMIASFLNRKCSETQLIEAVKDLLTVDLAKKNMRKWFGEGK